MLGSTKGRRPRIAPSRQGQLDQLCGVYAIVNAAQLAIGRNLKPVERLRLFREVILALGPAKLRTALIDGLTGTEIITAVRTRDWLAGSGLDLRISAPYARTAFVCWDHFLDRLGRDAADTNQAAILFVVEPGRQHWTVLKRISGSSIALYDSLGTKQLPRARYDIQGRYRIEPARTLLLRGVRASQDVAAAPSPQLSYFG